MKKVISIVLNNFKNDSRVLKENISLQKAGYDVKVIALHDGSSLQEFDNVQGVLVHRIKLKSKNWSKNKLIQMVKYIEYIYIVVKQYGSNCNIVHCNDLNALPIGVVMKKLVNKHIKIVYDAHEYETERNGLKGLRKKLTKILEKKCIKYADRVITVSDAIANEYVRLYNIDKPTVVLNAPLFAKLINKQDIFRNTFNITKEQIIFLYQGGLSKGRGIEIILDTFKILNDSNHPLYSKAVIVFMGYGILENLVQTAAQENDNVYLHNAVPPDILLKYTNSADIGISMIEDNCLSHVYTLPNKIFEYAMANIPVIVSNPYKRFIEKYEIGYTANTVEELINVIGRFIRSNKQEFQSHIKNFKRIYNWEEQEKILLNIYERL